MALLCNEAPTLMYRRTNLFSNSEEFGNHRGLGLIKGQVKKFIYSEELNTKFTIPQIGWNKIMLSKQKNKETS